LYATPISLRDELGMVVTVWFDSSMKIFAVDSKLVYSDNNILRATNVDIRMFENEISTFLLTQDNKFHRISINTKTKEKKHDVEDL
jgi:hypothetical protein